MNVNVEEVLDAVENQEHLGFCIKCGAAHEGFEPDAQKEKCSECGQMSVYGAEDILLMIS